MALGSYPCWSCAREPRGPSSSPLHPCAPPTTLHALLILSWRGCLAAGQASYTRHLGSLRQLAIHARNLRYHRILPCPSPPLRTEQAILEDHRRDDSFAKPRFSCYGIWCFTSRRRTIIVSFRGDVHPQNAGRTALSPYAVDVAGQHLTERFPPWRTLLHPRGTHPRAPPTTFARPAHPLLARLLGRRPSFVHSSSWIPPTACHPRS